MTNGKSTYSLDELRSRYKTELRACEVCGSKSFLQYQAFSRVGSALEYGFNQTLICTKCSYKMQNPRYPNDFYQEYYSESYRDVCFGTLKPDEKYINEQIERGERILNYCRKFFNSPKVVLDHGSASGGALIPFKKENWSCLGVDPHEASVNAGKEDLGLDIRLGLGEELPFESDSIDLIISLGSLEHSYDIEKSLEEIKRVLNKDGILLIRWRSDELWGSPLEYYNHNHYRFFTDSTLECLLAKYDLEVIEKTKEEIENKPGEVYTIAKLSDTSLSDKFHDMLEFYIKNNFSWKELQRLDKYRENYLKRCREFLDICNNLKDEEKIAEAIMINKGKNHRILLGDKKWAVLRAKEEAKFFIQLWNEGKVF